MHWQILQLDPATATLQDVRRAYARLVKSHRPDQDPEGFRRVQQAYEAALAELKYRGEAPQGGFAPVPLPPVAEPAEPLPRTEAPSYTEPQQPAMPAEMEAAFERLLDALSDPGMDLIPRLREVEETLFRWPAHVEEWSRRMGSMLERHQQVKGFYLSSKAMLCELMLERCSGSLHSVEEMDRQGEVAALEEAGKAILENKEDLGNYAAGLVAMALACYLTIWARGCPEDLVDFAYSLLGRDREALLNDYERSKNLAAILDCVPPDDRGFWKRWVERPGMKWDWNDQDNQVRLEVLAREADRHWPGYRLLYARLPQEVQAWLPSPESSAAVQTVNPSSSSSSGGGGSSHQWNGSGGGGQSPVPSKKRKPAPHRSWWKTLQNTRVRPTYAIFLVMIINVMRVFTNNHPPSPPPPPLKTELPLGRPISLDEFKRQRGMPLDPLKPSKVDPRNADFWVPPLVEPEKSRNPH